MSSQSSGRRRRPRFNRRTGIAIAAATAAIAGGATAVVASAAVPTAPDNILVFPDRDFVSVEGYQDRVGQTATLTATRGGTVIGQSQAVVQEGDVAFEVNHPGGVCWGVGAPADLKVTPDLKAGDKITITFNGGNEGDTTILDAAVDADAVQSGNDVTVTGHIGPEVDPLQIEQRIVQPDLRTTTVARRDVRAVPGGFVAAPKGGYSSGLTVGAANADGVRPVTAKYTFDTAQEAQLAANSALGERLMAWQVQDAAANRQGVTISEFGEQGGPGFGGCPQGPAAVGAPQPGQASAIRSADKTSVQVNWAPATAAAGSAAVTGYAIEAIGPAASGESPVIGKRTGAGATRVTLSGLTASADYTIEVRSLTGAKLSDPFTVATGGAPQNPGNPTLPTITADPVGGDSAATAVAASSVKLTGSTPDIYYTTDGSSAIEGDVPSLAAKLYTGPIAITGDTELHWAVFNADGLSDTGSGFYKKPAAAPPAAPTLGTSAVNGQSVTLRWNPVTGATKYGVQLSDSAGTLIGALRETTGTNLTIDNLPAGTYTFTVKAANADGYGPESVKSGNLVVTTADVVRISSAVWKAGDFRIIGSDSVVGAVLTVHRGSATGPVIGTPTSSVAATPPATGGAFDIRFRNAAAGTSNPGTIVITSDKGGVSPAFTVTNK